MSDALSWLSRTLKVIIRYFGISGGLFLLVLAFTVDADILSRVIAGQTIVGASEVGMLLLVIVVFFTLAHTQSIKGHVSMEALVSRMSPRNQRIALLVSLGTCLSISVILLYATSLAAYKSVISQEYQFGTLRFPLWPLKTAIAMGIALLSIQLSLDVIEATRSLLGKQQEL